MPPKIEFKTTDEVLSYLNKESKPNTKTDSKLPLKLKTLGVILIALEGLSSRDAVWCLNGAKEQIGMVRKAGYKRDSRRRNRCQSS